MAMPRAWALSSLVLNSEKGGRADSLRIEGLEKTGVDGVGDTNWAWT